MLSTSAFSFNPRSIYRNLMLLLTLSLITTILVAQSNPEAKRATAEKLLAEGIQLRDENSKESRQEALRKLKEAQSLFQSVNDRSREASTLLTIGFVYHSLGEAERALDYYGQALTLFRALGDRAGEADTLNNLSRLYFDTGQKPRALDYLTQALALYRAIGDRSGEGNALLGIGLIHSGSGEEQKALDYYGQASLLFRAVGDRKGEANALNNIGLHYARGSEKQKALDYYSRAGALYLALNDLEGSANTLNNMAAVYARLGQKQDALNYFSQVLSFFRTVGDRRAEASTLISIGSIRLDSGEKQKALDCYTQVLPLARAIGDREDEANALTGLGSVYASSYQKQLALDYFLQALPLHHEVGNSKGESNTLIGIGSIYDDVGDPQRALSYYEQALQLDLTVHDYEGQAESLNSMGYVYGALGEEQKALDLFAQALPLARTSGDRAHQATILSNIGASYSSFGEKQKAFDHYWQALPLFRSVEDRNGEAKTLNNIGKVYFVLGERQKALDYYAQALQVWRTVDDRAGEAATLGNMGETYADAGERQKALEHLNRALSLYRSIGDRGGEANMLIGVGTEQDEKRKAIDFYLQALSLARASRTRDIEANALYYLGSAYFDLGDQQKALAYSVEALSVFRDLHYDNRQAEALGMVSLIEENSGDLTEARVKLRAAIAIIESLRTKITHSELRASYFATMQAYYKHYIDLLMRLHNRHLNEGYDTEALQTSEHARARSLLETLSEANTDIRQAVDPQLVERERVLRQKLNGRAQAQAKLLAHDHTEDQAKAIAQEIEALTAELQQVEVRIRQSSPQYAALTQPQPLSLKEIQTQVLDGDTLLLEYSLGDERSYLWAVTPTSINSYELPKREKIEVAARRVYDLLNARNKRVKGETKEQWKARVEQADKQTPAAAAELSQMVLAPVAAELGKKRLAIVADGVLQYIPFASLPVPDGRMLSASGKAVTDRPQSSDNYQPLIAEHEIVSLPSASTLAVLRREVKGRPPAPKTVVALADPVFVKTDPRLKGDATKANGAAEEPKRAGAESVRELQLVEAAQNTGVSGDGLSIPRLPGTRREAEEIMALASAADRKLALDFAASRETASSAELSQYRYVHFSTHGFLNSVHPELSGLVFSLVNERGETQDGFLRAHEVFNLRLPAELVVLSACQTGIGKEIKGEGLVSLTRGFMYAGSPRVVVSLWSVSEMGTTELMVRFYREMLKEGKPPAAALRAAQLSLMKEKRWASPYYWAPFVLQGEWR